MKRTNSRSERGTKLQATRSRIARSLNPGLGGHWQTTNCECLQDSAAQLGKHDQRKEGSKRPENHLEWDWKQQHIDNTTPNHYARSKAPTNVMGWRDPANITDLKHSWSQVVQLRSNRPDALLEELPGAEVQSAPWCVDQPTGHPDEQESTICFGVYVITFATSEQVWRQVDGQITAPH